MERILHKRILNEKEAAQYLGLGLTKFRYYDAQGWIPKVRYPENTRKLYDILQLDEIVERLKQGKLHAGV